MIVSIDYEQAASARQCRSLPIFSGRNLAFGHHRNGMILPLFALFGVSEF
jgi:hypothetical protein